MARYHISMLAATTTVTVLMLSHSTDATNDVMMLLQLHATGNLSEASSSCDCQGKWEYKNDGETYNGCVETPDWPGHNWCYVEDSSCGSSKRSEVPGETRHYRECKTSACACAAEWEYMRDGETYHDCTETPDWPGHHWCYVQDGIQCKSSKRSEVSGEARHYIECKASPCACAGEWTYNLDGETYSGCAATADWTGHNWCYVQDAGKCESSIPSEVNGEARQYRECDASPCACAGEWEYKKDGETYSGCAETPDWTGHNWCYVQDGAKCDSSMRSEVAGEARHYRECKASPCSCAGEWQYKRDNETYSACAETSDWRGHNWCYVEDGSKCDASIHSEVAGETRHYRECKASSCACEGVWEYKRDGETYNGCAETRDWKGHSWCYVQNGDKCASSSPSEVSGEARHYRECKSMPCACEGEWLYKNDGATYSGCVETSDWLGHDWCYVQDGAKCDSSKRSEVLSETRHYRECTASPCVCQGEWEYQRDGQTYNGCVETPDWSGHHWCYVQDSTQCHSSKRSEVSGEARHYIECKASPCACAGEWEYKKDGETYNFCAETPDWTGHNWCYVEDGAECDASKRSEIPSEPRHYRECKVSTCACDEEWEYKKDGETYGGCAATPDWPDHHWCYVQDGANCNSAIHSEVPRETRRYRECSTSPCACEGGWEYKRDGKHYNGCAATLDWADHNWCYVQDSAKCDSSISSEINGETRQYRECKASPCACAGEWEYKKDGETYSGCVETPDWSGHNWCYVQDAANCDASRRSEIATETRHYLECKASPCACEGEWEYKRNGETYDGCTETPDWPGHHWCYVQDGTNCASAIPSEVHGEARHYLECKASPCACEGEWEYNRNGETYVGCAETPDWLGHNWCYVEDAAQCDASISSEVPGEVRHYRECKASPCACVGEWEYKKDGETYSGCTETPDWKGHNWCYVQDGTQCDSSKHSKVVGETQRYRECAASPCACAGEWEYKKDGESYNGCAETPDWQGHGWCYVQDELKCDSSIPSEVPSETRHYRECNASPCACAGEWGYKLDGETYSGCSETPDWRGHTWCYVQDGEKCDSSMRSEIQTETRHFRECQGSPCACEGQWEYKKDGTTYNGCTETPDWAGHHWCYVKDAITCDSSSSSEIHGETRHYRECEDSTTLPLVDCDGLDPGDACSLKEQGTIVFGVCTGHGSSPLKCGKAGKGDKGGKRN